MKQRSSRPVDPLADLNTPFHQEAERVHAGGLQPEKITAVPRCVGVLSLASWRALVVAMNDALRPFGLLVRFVGDHFRAVSSDGAMMVLHLDKLALRCRGRSPDAIRVEVEAHVGRVLSARSVLAAEGPMPFSEAAPRLLAQVSREDMLTAGADALVRPLCEGLVTTLAMDVGPAIVTVSRSWCEAWGEPDDALLRRGVENLRRRPVQRGELAYGGQGFMLTSDELTTAAQVHLLATHLGSAPGAGALVLLPTRGLLLCVPLVAGSTAGVMTAVRETFELMRDLWEGLALYAPTEPEFSRDLYWWHEGTLRRFPVRIHGRLAMMVPPPGFVEVVESLARRDAN